MTMTQEQAIEKSKKWCLHGWGFIPIAVESGKGSVFKDLNGKEYLDFLSQTAGVLGIGHSHPKMIKYVKEQVEKIQHVLTSFVTPLRAEFGEKLAALAPPPLKNNCQMYIANGGSEANETAIKMAMLVTGKKEVISQYHAYHGGTLALMGLLAQAPHRKGFLRYPGFHNIPATPYCYRCYQGKKYPDCDHECARQLGYHLKWGVEEDSVAAFIQEPITGNGGHMGPNDNNHEKGPDLEYHKIIRETCDEYNVLYISDEVQTGMGRLGENWGCMRYQMKPDIFTTAKALGGGLPVSAAVIRKDLVPENLSEGQWHIFTMGGSPITLAGGIAALEVLVEEKLPQQAKEKGDRAYKILKEWEDKHKIVGEVRGEGAFIGIELVKDKKTKKKAIDEAGAIFTKCLENGLLIGVSAVGGWGNVLKIKPPLNTSEEQWDKALEILEGAISDVEKSM
ncbi:MAG: aspartate aminotransferase family protein [Candidatus Odinarchaeia archaeon]